MGLKWPLADKVRPEYDSCAWNKLSSEITLVFLFLSRSGGKCLGLHVHSARLFCADLRGSVC